MSEQNNPHERNTDPIWTAVRWDDDDGLIARHRDGGELPTASAIWVFTRLAGVTLSHAGGRVNAEKRAAKYGLAFPEGWVPGVGVPEAPKAGVTLPAGWEEEEARIDVDLCIVNPSKNRSIHIEPRRVGVSFGGLNDAFACVYVDRDALVAALALWEDRHGSGQ